MTPRPRRPDAVSTLRRTIHFYRIDTGVDSAGKPIPLDLDEVLQKLHTKPFTPLGTGGRYLPQADDEDLCAWVDTGVQPHRLRLARLRRNGLPQAELGGNLTAVRIGRGSALYEATHLLFLPGNIVGAEFNFYGPRPTRLPGYLAAVTGGDPVGFTLEQILRQDAADQLDQQHGLRLLDLRIRPTYAATVGESSASLGAALEAAAGVGQSDIVGVFLQAEPRSRAARLSEAILGATRQLARRGDLRANTTHFSVKGIGPNGRVEPIDLLSDQLVAVRQVAKMDARSRAVDSDSAYAAVQSAYDQLTQEGLLDGPSVTGLSDT